MFSAAFEPTSYIGHDLVVLSAAFESTYYIGHDLVVLSAAFESTSYIGNDLVVLSAAFKCTTSCTGHDITALGDEALSNVHDCVVRLLHLYLLLLYPELPSLILMLLSQYLMFLSQDWNLAFLFAFFFCAFLCPWWFLVSVTLALCTRLFRHCTFGRWQPFM